MIPNIAPKGSAIMNKNLIKPEKSRELTIWTIIISPMITITNPINVCTILLTI